MSVKAITKDEMNLLRDIREMFEKMGLGNTYGYLGRNQAIIHHSILHDDPHCRTLDKNGKYKKCKLSQGELIAMCELCNNEASILEFAQKKFFEKIGKMIDSHLTKTNFDEKHSMKKPSSNSRLRPNYCMLPKIRIKESPVTRKVVAKKGAK